MRGEEGGGAGSGAQGGAHLRWQSVGGAHQDNLRLPPLDVHPGHRCAALLPVVQDDVVDQEVAPVLPHPVRHDLDPAGQPPQQHRAPLVEQREDLGRHGGLESALPQDGPHLLGRHGLRHRLRRLVPDDHGAVVLVAPRHAGVLYLRGQRQVQRVLPAGARRRVFGRRNTIGGQSPQPLVPQNHYGRKGRASSPIPYGRTRAME